uniref:Uncharacterized protein n=1 Tax=Anguilla anguilla TaxID=7936 RepID=A0A0E9UYD6_ANGAN
MDQILNLAIQETGSKRTLGTGHILGEMPTILNME